jgi:hypothetical protein
VEKRFGEEGQKICVETLVDVGKQAWKEILLKDTILEGLSEIEKISFLASWVNRNVYASPDVPKTGSSKKKRNIASIMLSTYLVLHHSISFFAMSLQHSLQIGRRLLRW